MVIFPATCNEETVNCNTNYGSRYDNYFEIRDADTPAANLSVTIANEDQATLVSDATTVITGDDERLRFYFTCTASGQIENRKEQPLTLILIWMA